VGFAVMLVAIIVLLSTIDPQINDATFAFAMAMLGIGMGLVASQLGNVVQSAVGARERGEAGGLQNTAQQLGASLGTALIGAIVISLLITAFQTKVEEDPRIAEPVKGQVGLALEGDVSFVESDQVKDAAARAGVEEATAARLVESYEDAQLVALKTGLLAAGFIVVAGLFATGGLPTRRFSELADADAAASPASA
jgi:hypothetical protein